MAYPEPIKTVGALSLQNDVFEYFKGATQAMLEQEEQGEYIYIGWIFDFALSFGGNNYPITRSEFNTIINANFWDTDDLLYADEPESGWPIDKVNDWAKVQSIMLAVFGSRTGSTSQTSLSYLTGIRSNTSNWRVSDMNLLRFALTKFDTYGACYPEEIFMPPPTNPVTDDVARTFTWTNAPGYPNNNDYEYQLNFSDWELVSSKPIVIPAEIDVPAGNLAVRTRGREYYSPSTEIVNFIAIPSLGVVVQLTVYCYSTGTQVMWSAGAGINYAIDQSLTINGTANYTISAGGSNPFNFGVTINPGQTGGSNGGPTGGPVGQVTLTQITGAIATPPEINGEPVEINY